MTSSDLLPPPPPTSPGAASGTTEHKPYSHLQKLRLHHIMQKRLHNLRPFLFAQKLYISYLMLENDLGPNSICCTCILCPGLNGHWAGFSNANTVSGQNTKLILHPGVEVHHSGRQRVPIDYFRDYKRCNR